MKSPLPCPPCLRMTAFMVVISNVASAFPALAEHSAPAFTLIPAHSTIGFIATVNGAESKGSFTAFKSDIFFDPEDLSGSHVRLDIDMNAIDAAYEQVATALVTEPWFDAAAHPRAIVEAKQLTHDEADSYSATADMTLRGTTHPITLHFTVNEYTEHKAEVTGHTTFSRTQFGVGQGEWADTSLVADAVKVTFHLVAERVNHAE